MTLSSVTWPMSVTPASATQMATYWPVGSQRTDQLVTIPGSEPTGTRCGRPVEVSGGEEGWPRRGGRDRTADRLIGRGQGAGRIARLGGGRSLRRRGGRRGRRRLGSIAAHLSGDQVEVGPGIEVEVALTGPVQSGRLVERHGAGPVHDEAARRVDHRHQHRAVDLPDLGDARVVDVRHRGDRGRPGDRRRRGGSVRGAGSRRRRARRRVRLGVGLGELAEEDLRPEPAGEEIGVAGGHGLGLRPPDSPDEHVGAGAHAHGSGGKGEPLAIGGELGSATDDLVAVEDRRRLGAARRDRGGPGRCGSGTLGRLRRGARGRARLYRRAWAG